jgi:hypothetical protein
MEANTQVTKKPALLNDLAHPNTTKNCMKSRISEHLELNNNVIGLCIDQAAQVDTDCYIPRFSGFASPHLGMKTESPPGYLPIHINAV